MRKYRFFYHYNKNLGQMSIHFRNKCYIVDKLICHTTCETKWNKTQPRLVMQGFASQVIISDRDITDNKIVGNIID